MSNNSRIRKNVEEPSIAPEPDHWYNLTLGPSFNNRSSTKFCTLRYEFKPASIDNCQPGSLHKNKENRVTVEFQNNQHGKPKVAFEGSNEDHKENDAVLFFDGESFRLERLHRAVKRLRHVRLPGEAVTNSVTPASSIGQSITDPCSSPIGKGTKFQSSNKVVFHSMPVEVERIEVGDLESIDAKSEDENPVAHPPSSDPNPTPISPKIRSPNLEEALEGASDDEIHRGAPKSIGGMNDGIDINIAQQTEIEDEIADVDMSDDGGADDKGRNAAEELRAQVNAVAEGGTSSSSGSSGSESSSESSSSVSESSDSDSVNSI